MSDYRPETKILQDEALLRFEDGAILVSNGQRPVLLANTLDFKRHSCGGWVNGRRLCTHTRGVGGYPYDCDSDELGEVWPRSAMFRRGVRSSLLSMKWLLCGPVGPRKPHLAFLC